MTGNVAPGLEVFGTLAGWQKDWLRVAGIVAARQSRQFPQCMVS